MPKKARHNIPEHTRGDTWKGFSFKWKLGGEYVDFTGCAIKIEWKRNGNIVHTSSTSDPGGISWSAITIDNTNVTVGKFQTAAWTKSILQYDTEITWPNGDIETLFGGVFPIDGDQTNS